MIMLRTNFSKKDLKIYELAIEEFKAKTGSNRLSIHEKAYDIHERIIKDAMALHDSENVDLSLFWDISDRIRNDIKQTENQVMLENMQYYMEYCQSNGYVTPMDWLTKYKHF